MPNLATTQTITGVLIAVLSIVGMAIAGAVRFDRVEQGQHRQQVVIDAHGTELLDHDRMLRETAFDVKWIRQELERNKERWRTELAPPEIRRR